MEEWNLVELKVNRFGQWKGNREFIWTGLIVIVKICYKMISEKGLE